MHKASGSIRHAACFASCGDAVPWSAPLASAVTRLPGAAGAGDSSGAASLYVSCSWCVCGWASSGRPVVVGACLGWWAGQSRMQLRQRQVIQAPAASNTQLILRPFSVVLVVSHVGTVDDSMCFSSSLVYPRACRSPWVDGCRLPSAAYSECRRFGAQTTSPMTPCTIKIII